MSVASARAWAVLSVLPVAVVVNDLLATVHTLPRAECGLAAGDVVCVSRLATRVEEPRRGDVVLLRAADGASPPYIASLRALPGDFGVADWQRIPPGRCTLAADGAELVPLALVEGRVTAVLWPPAHARAVPRAPHRY